jgi:ParB-like chromosome segregation protein Spo0J
MDEGFRVQWIPIRRLKPAAYNPRKDLGPDDLEYKKIQKSLNEFGLVDPLVVNKDNTVIGGHQRLKVLADAGFDKVPCSIVDLDKKRERALNIALNKISGEWDFPKLSELLIELDTGDFDMDLTGWDEKELEGLLVDKPGDLDREEYKIIVTDLNEASQTELLQRLLSEGYKCKVS